MAGARTIWLVEVDAYVDGVGLTTLRYSDEGYQTLPDDSPADTAYPARVIDPGTVTRTIFAGGTTFGRVEVGYGRIVLSNADGGLDALRTYGFGRRVVVKSITTTRQRGVAYSEAVARFTGIVAHVEADFDVVQLVLRDELGQLEVPYMDARFAGSSASTTGIEGNGNIQGQIKPAALGGLLRNISPYLVNASEEVYAWSHRPDGTTAPSASLAALRNGGGTYTLSGIDREDEAALFAASVPLGEADTALASSLLRLNGSVTAGLTADVHVSAAFTNLFEASEDIAGTADSIDGGMQRRSATLTAGQHPAPDGVGTMDLLAPAGGSAEHGMRARRGSIAAGTGYRVFAAVFVKALGGRYVQWRARADTTGKGGRITVDLADGSIVASTGLNSGIVVSASVTGYGDGVYRLELLADALSDSSGLPGIAELLVLDGSLATTHADMSQTVYVWGCQLHTDASAILPYIRSTGTAATLRCHATAGRVAEAVLAAHGFLLEPASVLSLDRQVRHGVALYVTDESSVLDLAEQALGSVGAALVPTATGTFRAVRFEAPSGTPLKAIAEWEILDDGPDTIALLPTDDGPSPGVPFWRLTVLWGRNWTPQSEGELVGSVSPDDRVAYAEQWRRVVVEDAAVRTRHPQAPETEIATALDTEADAAAEAVRRLDFLKSNKTRFRVPLHTTRAVRDADGTTPIDIGDHVTLAMSRFGFATPADFVVIGKDEALGNGVVFLDIVNSDHW